MAWWAACTNTTWQADPGFSRCSAAAAAMESKGSFWWRQQRWCRQRCQWQSERQGRDGRTSHELGGGATGPAIRRPKAGASYEHQRTRRRLQASGSAVAPARQLCISASRSISTSRCLPETRSPGCPYRRSQFRTKPARHRHEAEVQPGGGSCGTAAGTEAFQRRQLRVGQASVWSGELPRKRQRWSAAKPDAVRSAASGIHAAPGCAVAFAGG